MEDKAVGRGKDAVANRSRVVLQAQPESLVALGRRRGRIDEHVGPLGFGRDQVHVATPVQLNQSEVGLAPVTAVFGLRIPKPRGIQDVAGHGRGVPAAAEPVVIQDRVLEVDVVLPGTIAPDGDAAQPRRVHTQGNALSPIRQRQIDEQMLPRTQPAYVATHGSHSKSVGVSANAVHQLRRSWTSASACNNTVVRTTHQPHEGNATWHTGPESRLNTAANETISLKPSVRRRRYWASMRPMLGS